MSKATKIHIEFADGGQRYPWSQTPFARHEAALLRDDCVIAASFLSRRDFESLYPAEPSL